MPREKMERRTFIKKAASAFFGIMTSRLWTRDLPVAQAEKGALLQYRTLGRTGLKVTTVGMGVMNCSDPAVLLRAYDLGINFYDTADCYMRGRNEEMVGKTFKGKRDKVLIQTKVHDGDEKKMRASVERSLRRLQTDVIDVLVWHGLSSTEEVSNPALQDFMLKMKKEGKARFTGFSSHSRMAALLREASKLDYHDVALVSYNFTHSKELRDAVAAAAKSGIGIVAMKTQSGGYKKEKMEGLTPHQAALKYILRDPHVATTVPGVTTIEQIEECAGVMRTAFSQDDLGHLRRYQAFLEGRVCTFCGGCTGACPEGFPVHEMLRAVMYHDGYENDDLVKQVLQTVASRKTIPCSKCSSCEVVCRRGLNLKEQVERAWELLA